MEILYLLVPVSVVLVFAIGLAFWWSLKSGQFDDLEGPAYRILMDDDRPVDAGRTDQVDALAPPPRKLSGEVSGDGKKDAPV